MKYLLVLFFLISVSFSYANLYISGPYAFELQWIDGEWHLELGNADVFPPTLDECYLECNAGSSFFNNIYFPSNQLTVVTKDDLNIPFELDPEHDEIVLGWEGSYGNEPSCYINYGYSYLSMPPLEGESLVRKPFADPFFPIAFYLYCRDNSPTMGQTNDDIGFTGTFSGSVINDQGEPLPGVVIEYFPPLGANQIISNLDGEFSLEMNTVRYDIDVKYNETTYITTRIRIAPDSNTVKSFILPIPSTSTLPYLLELTEIKMSNYPNPFNPTTTISFDLNPNHIENAELVIYNSKGQKVKKLEITNLKFGKNKVVWDGNDERNKSVASGVYYARLKADGIVLKECKMLLLK